MLFRSIAVYLSILLHCMSPEMADAVEKVGAILLEWNNRIIGVDFLNRTCAVDAQFESMLLREPLKIFFRQRGSSWPFRPRRQHVRCTADSCTADL